jgi:DNA-binding response OmpR family regulator
MKDASANILFKVLDDDPEELEVVEVVCKEYGIMNYQLHTDEEGFFKNMNSDINLLLIDHRLKLKDGLDITRRVKSMNVDNYVIVASLIQDFDVAVAYLRAGADDWLKKYETNYLDQLVLALRKGFSEAQKRIDNNKKIKLLEVDTINSMNEIAKLAAKLNPRKNGSDD